MTESLAFENQTRLRWEEANRADLEAALGRLRLLLGRRVDELRVAWREDPLARFREEVVSDEEADQLLAPRAAGRSSETAPPEAGSDAFERQLGELRDRRAAAAAAAEQAGSPPALVALARLFELTPFEVDVLVLCLAPELDPGFERLYGYVQDDLQRRYPTPHLALALFAEVEGAGHGAFLPRAPLRRGRLVTLEPAPQPGTPTASCPLRLDARIADYLRGVNRVDERVAGLLRRLPRLPLAGFHRELVARLKESLANEPPWPVVQLLGSGGAGRSAVAAALAKATGLRPVRLEASRLPAAEAGGEKRRRTLWLLEREAALLQLAFYVEMDEPMVGGEVDGARGGERRPAGDSSRLAEELGALLIFAAPARLALRVPTFAVPVRRLDAGEQRGLWHEALGPVAAELRADIERLAEQFDLGPREIVEAVAAAEGLARLRAPGEAAVEAADLWRACRERSGLDLARLARRIEPCYAWDDIVLPAESSELLHEIAGQVEARYTVYEEWGFGRKLARGRGIAALFSGTSGTGKTMAAEILAGDLGLELYRIDLAGVVSKYIGETEKNLKRVFAAAERSGAILFFDEADALFGKRTEVRDSHDRYANIEVNYLLQRMEDYRGLAILATNRRGDLDAAFLRRLRFVVEFPFPDRANRREIWRRVFPPEAPLAELDVDALAKLEIAGGSIRNIALNAAFAARAAGEAISMPHLERAARREYAKLEKLMGPEPVR